MKRLLVLNDFPLLPPDHAGKLCLLELYSRLAAQFEVTYVCLWSGSRVETDPVSDNFRQVRVPKGRVHAKIAEILNGRLGAPVDDIVAMLMCRGNPALRSIVQRGLRWCDAVVLAHPYLYPAVPLTARVPIIYDSLNVETLLKGSILGDGRLGRVLSSSVRWNERNLVRRATAVFAKSEVDIAGFTGLFPVRRDKFHLSPIGADLSAGARVLPRGTSAEGRRHAALFVGSGHPPNVVAARTIIRDIAPALPDVDFSLCGSVGEALRGELHPDNVELTFWLPEEAKWALYSRVQIALNPMDLGSGVNAKMLEYMAAGLPVVTTPIGARGLGLDRSTAEICETSQFSRAIEALLADPERRAELSANGRRHVEDHFAWPRIAESVAAVVDNVIPARLRAVTWTEAGVRRGSPDA